MIKLAASIYGYTTVGASVDDKTGFICSVDGNTTVAASVDDKTGCICRW